MSYDPGIHHRRSIRLRGFDYSSAGAYFITICVQNRECLFGNIADDDMLLNDAGRMIQITWEALPERQNAAQLDAFSVMPNHFHGIVILSRGEPCVRPLATEDASGHGYNANDGEDKIHPYGTSENSLGRVIQAFKSLTTHAYAKGVKRLAWRRFPGTLWQRNYYERVIRNENELACARDYILNNPMKWGLDPENPAYSR